MTGLRLDDMDACDALDVIHVLMEEDSIVQSREIHASKQEVRAIIYGQMYEDPSWLSRKTGGDYQSNTAWAPLDPALDSVADQPMRSKAPKPYFPPTDPERLPTILDAPLG
jgi:hypothetical protein